VVGVWRCSSREIFGLALTNFVYPCPGTRYAECGLGLLFLTGLFVRASTRTFDAFYGIPRDRGSVYLSGVVFMIDRFW